MPTKTTQSKSKIDSLDALYLHQLQDLYDAEKRILKALPKMIKAASSEDLQKALRNHESVTKKQKERLEKIFKDLGEKAEAEPCKAIQGILEEGEELLEELDKGAVGDAGIIAAAQRVEHYEMAAYGATRTFAKVLGHKDAATLLQETLDEEGQADKELTNLASKLNRAAKKVGA